MLGEGGPTMRDETDGDFVDRLTLASWGGRWKGPGKM